MRYPFIYWSHITEASLKSDCFASRVSSTPLLIKNPSATSISSGVVTCIQYSHIQSCSQTLHTDTVRFSTSACKCSITADSPHSHSKAKTAVLCLLTNAVCMCMHTLMLVYDPWVTFTGLPKASMMETSSVTSSLFCLTSSKPSLSMSGCIT